MTQFTNILCDGFGRPNMLPVVEGLAQAWPLQNLTAIDARSDALQASLGDNLNLTTFDYSVLLTAQYDDLDDAPPLDAPTLARYAKLEAITLRMAERFNNIIKLTPGENREIFYRHLRYWRHYLQSNNIDLFVGSNLPHYVVDYVIAELCREMNIPTMFFGFTYLDRALSVFGDWKRPALGYQESLDAMLASYQKSQTLPQLEGIYAQHWEQQLQKRREGFYVDAFKKRLKDGRKLTRHARKLMRGLWQSDIRTGKFLRSNGTAQAIERSTLAHQSWQRANTLDKAYSGLACEPDQTQSFVYVPLHLQPELSTLPIGEYYSDQKLIVDQLLSHIPDDWFVYVKEHPFQIENNRSVRWYTELSAHPRVKLIQKWVDSFELIANAKAVATICGSAGWDALFRGIPAMIYGHVTYTNFPGVFPVQSNAECADAVKQICSGTTIDRDLLQVHFAAYAASSIEAYNDVFYGQVAEHDPRENAQRLLQALLDYAPLAVEQATN